MAVPGYVGTTGGGIAGSGSFTVSLPASSTGYLAIGSWRGTTSQLTAPTGWTAVIGPATSSPDDFSVYGVWTASTSTSPGTSWNHGTANGGANVIILGYDGALTLHQNAGATGGDGTIAANPTVTTAELALIARAVLSNAYSGAPTWGYPSGHATGQTQRNQLASGEYWSGAIAHVAQSSSGATGTAQYTETGTTPWYPRSLTLALTTSGGGTAGTITTTVGSATADGQSASFNAGSTIATTVASATADGGSSTFGVAATISTAVGDATADGASTSFIASSTLSTTASSATADGGSSVFSTTGTIPTLTGDATADGGSSAWSAGSTLTTTASSATADGGSSTFTGGTAGTISTAVGDATADGGTTAYTASSTFGTDGGSATADGGVGAFTAGGSANLVTSVGDATADGQAGGFTAAGTFTSATGSADADGALSTFDTATVLTTLAAAATADGGITGWLAAATLSTLVGEATAAGGVSTFIGTGGERDITVTVTGPVGHPLKVQRLDGNPLVVSVSGHPLTVTATTI